MGQALLEHLPDEIILQVCSYLRPFEIIDGFGQLNSRLSRTISQYRHNSDIHHLTLTQYRKWYSCLLPHTASSIAKLVLSNWNAPGQIHMFNQSTHGYQSLRQFLPNLQQLRLIDFSNDDVDILPKLAMIDRILIDIDALRPLLYSTKLLLDRYLFCSAFPFKEVRLWVGDNGIRLQHNADVVANPHLEQLTIIVAHIDDLILLFKRSPNLIKLYAEINSFSSDEPKQYATAEVMPKKLTDFHIQTNDHKALTFDDLFVIVIHIPTIKLLSLDIETTDMDYADGLCWTLLTSRLPKLTRLYFRTRIWMGPSGGGGGCIDINPFVQSFARTNLPIICYADSRVLHIDTVPYDMHEFATNMSVTSSPFVRYGRATNLEFCQRQARTVRSLFLCGRHERTSIGDWLHVLNRFRCIQALDLTSVNIVDQISPKEQLCLPRLIALRYVRSTKCEINIPFFLLLVTKSSVTPCLRALTIMYGDLIYLCKRLPAITFDRLKELWLFSSNSDGRVVIQDVDILLKAFPSLRNFSFLMHSSRSINRHIEQIIEMILCSLPNLISFRLACRKGSFLTPSLENDEMRQAWIERVLRVDKSAPMHLIFRRREISIWK